MSGWKKQSSFPAMSSTQYQEVSTSDPNLRSSKPKKKLGLFSKSKSNETKAAKYDERECYCDECRQSAQSSKYLTRDIEQQQYYYPNMNRATNERTLSTAQQTYNNESLYANHHYEQIYTPPQQYLCECSNCRKRRGANLTTELLPLDTQIPLQMMSDSALLCNIL